MGELRDLFEDGTGGFRPSTDEALERTRQRAERRARNRRLLAASVALALAATTLSGLWAAFRLGGESRPAAPVGVPEQVLPAPSSSAIPPDGVCPPPEVEAGYLPPGVEPGHPQPGTGGGADPDGQFTNAIHFGSSPGPDGGPAPFIEIIRTGPDGGPLLPEDHARRLGEPIEVLGGEGYLVSIEDGWGVWFQHGDDPCSGYELHAYGPTKAETRRFAARLRPSVPRPAAIEPSSPPAELGISYPFTSGHCGLSWIVDFDGSFWEPLPGAPEDLLINQSSGTMTRVGPDEARFEADDGRSARLRRLQGPFVPEACD